MRTKSTPRIVLWALIALYACLAAFDIFRQKITAIDSIQAIILCGALLMVSYRWKLSSMGSILAGLIFLPNAIGQLGAYGSPVFQGHYDWIVHLSVAFMGVIFFAGFIIQNKLAKGFGNALIGAFLLTVMCGAFVEAGEYWSFIFFGFGDGYLGFGSGDNSTHYGPWENSSLDTTNNFLGAGIGVLISFLIERKKKRR